ncbi:MAG: hypothetical protein GXO83_12665 [Chlorobi bacterium]|nr:hypothetical protein [Chlorobiota bacterium]
MARKRYRLLFSPAILILLFLLPQGCIKDKYDFNKLSTRAQIQPSWVFPVMKGSLQMGNLVKPNDTIVFEDNNAIKVVFREDSIFTFRAAEVLDIPDQALETVRFPLGAYRLEDFFYNGDITLDQMAQNFDPALYSLLQTRDGTNAIFPPIPDQPGGSYSLTPFPNFTQVTFSSGIISLTVGNNLPVDLSSLTLRLKRTSDGTTVGNDFVYGGIAAGTSKTQTMDLAGLTVPNDLTLEIVTIGSPGSTPNTVLINLADGLSISLASSDIMVASGNAVIPDQVFFADTDIFNLNVDTVQLTFLAIHSGEIEYTITSPFSENLVLHLTLPTGRKNNDTLRYDIQVTKKKSLQQILSLDSAAIDLSTITSQPYNMLPFEYKVELLSSGNLVNFDLTDSITFSYQLKNMSFQYVKGYFGQHEFLVPRDSVNVGLDEFFADINGTISLTNPKVSVLYRNGFGIPARAQLNVVGKTNDGNSQPLNAPAIDISYPQDISDSSTEGTIVFDKNTSDIVPLIDLHPAWVVYGGNAKLNPDGFQGFTNFISRGSSIVGDLEVEVPLEFRIQDLELKDTVENPFNSDPTDSSGFGLGDLDYAKLYVSVNNGFPVGVDFKIYMYDSINRVIVDSIVIDKAIDAAPVDNAGRVTEPIKGSQIVELGQTELDNLQTVDNLIFTIIFNSTNNGTVDVKIYTDYTFDFNLAFGTKVNLDF